MEFIKVDTVPYNEATVSKLKAFLESHGLDKAILGEPIEGNVPMHITLVQDLDQVSRKQLFKDLSLLAREIYMSSDVDELDVDNMIGVIIEDKLSDVVLFGSECFYKEGSFWVVK